MTIHKEKQPEFENIQEFIKWLNTASEKKRLEEISQETPKECAQYG